MKLSLDIWLKPEDVKGNNKIIKFLDEGKIVAKSERNILVKDGEEPNLFEIKVCLGKTGEERVWTMSKTNQRKVAEYYGSDTKDWIGKTAELTVKNQVIGKTEREVIYVKG